MNKGVWMRICDADGIEQSSVMVIDDYTFYLHSVADNSGAMLIDYEHEAGANARNAHELTGLARRLQQPDGANLYAGNGAQLLRSAA